MKKIKMMLLSLALMAVVGGALAFKASMFDGAYCTAAPLFSQGIPYCERPDIATADCE